MIKAGETYETAKGCKVKIVSASSVRFYGSNGVEYNRFGQPFYYPQNTELYLLATKPAGENND